MFFKVLHLYVWEILSSKHMDCRHTCRFWQSPWSFLYQHLKQFFLKCKGSKIATQLYRKEEKQIEIYSKKHPQPQDKGGGKQKEAGDSENSKQEITFISISISDFSSTSPRFLYGLPKEKNDKTPHQWWSRDFGIDRNAAWCPSKFLSEHTTCFQMLKG